MLKGILIIATFGLLVSCKNNVSSPLSNSTVIQPVVDCMKSDTKAPTLINEITINIEGSLLVSPEFSWVEAMDDCNFSHYEVAIGLSPNDQDVLNYINVGAETKYSQYGLELSYDEDYYFFIKAVDASGNKSAPIVSQAWQIFTPKSLTGLVLWLDAAQLSSVSDQEGDHPGDADFSNEVSSWKDLSDSSAVHDFISAGASAPNWDVLENAIRFNGSNHFMATADHADINTSVVGQRTLVAAFKTDSDISSRQVIFEEGGGMRGINIYIENNELHCGFWNAKDDGDGFQDYIETTQVIEQSSGYVVSFVYDYGHFVDSNSTDGTVECFLNESSIGQVLTTSRLHAHSGDIGLGAMNDGSYFHDGASSGDQFYFKGVIYEFLLYNSAHNNQNISNLNQIMQLKWF